MKMVCVLTLTIGKTGAWESGAAAGGGAEYEDGGGKLLLAAMADFSSSRRMPASFCCCFLRRRRNSAPTSSAATGIRTPKAIPAFAPPERPSFAEADVDVARDAESEDEASAPKAFGVLRGLVTGTMGVGVGCTGTNGLDSAVGAIVSNAWSSSADVLEKKTAPPAIAPPAKGVSVTMTASPLKVCGAVIVVT
jgi:hypothetical protein